MLSTWCKINETIELITSKSPNPYNTVNPVGTSLTTLINEVKRAWEKSN